MSTKPLWMRLCEQVRGIVCHFLGLFCVNRIALCVNPAVEELNFFISWKVSKDKVCQGSVNEKFGRLKIL